MAMKVESIAGVRAFVAAADAQGFKRGGETLGLTSSAIGKAIARLEEQLAVQLFHRTTRTLSLTEQGAMFLIRAKAILAQLEDAEAELASTSKDLKGPLRISLPLTGGALSKPLADFVALHPGIELDLDFSDRMVDVIGEGFDAVIRSGEQSDSRLMRQKLGTIVWCLAAAPAYVERAGLPMRPSDLAGHACLRQRVSTGRIAPWTLREDVTIPASLTAGIIDPLLDMALAGAGIASFPFFMIHDYLKSGRLIEILPGSLDRQGVMSILWPSTRYDVPKTKAFVGVLVAWAQRALRAG
ncbi:LysR family transcriptional regulator [Sphingobium yanoikuyae]|uniref:LysR family transcriptional regulator n=1 Tax=Sphingobium yanoikuyae TaxID=13690 RepID=UPI0035C6B49B